MCTHAASSCLDFERGLNPSPNKQLQTDTPMIEAVSFQLQLITAHRKTRPGHLKPVTSRLVEPRVTLTWTYRTRILKMSEALAR